MTSFDGSSNVSFVYDFQNRRILTSNFTIDQAPEKVWRFLCMPPSFFGALPMVLTTKCREHDQWGFLIDITLSVSKSIGITKSATLKASLDHGAYKLSIASAHSDSYIASMQLRPDDNGKGKCHIHYESVFDLTIAGLRVPFLDAKLTRLTQDISETMRKCIIERSWYQEFTNTFGSLVVDELVQARDLADAVAFEDIRTHLCKMLEHTTLGGKAYRALLIRLTVQCLLHTPKESLDEKMQTQIHAAGHLIELLQAMALVADDIMDQSETRRGKPCWYLTVGTPCAINDTLVLYSAVYRTLCSYFSHDSGDHFEGIVRLVSDTMIQTCMGQMLDTMSEGVGVQMATPKRSEAIIKYKTAYYTVYAPMALAIYICRLEESLETHLLKNAHTVSMHLGALFQEQDDYLDLYGDPTKTGKVIGMDIIDGKTTWILAYAMEHVNETSAAELKTLYGTNADVSRVKQLFDEVGIHEEFQRRQLACVDQCLQLADVRLQSVVSSILAELIHRKA